MPADMFWFCDQQENSVRLRDSSAKLNTVGKRLPVFNAKLDGTSGAVGKVDIYHSHLASSLKAFQNKIWKPLKKTPVEMTQVTSSATKQTRPATAVRRHHRNRPSSSTSVRTRRPQSVPANALRYMACRPATPVVTAGDFDTLSPDILADLMGEINMTSEPVDENTNKEEQHEPSQLETTKELKTKATHESKRPLLVKKDAMEKPLRPEKLDLIYVPPDKKDKSRYDFDAETVDVPLNEFQSALPEPFSRLDFKVIAREKYDWREILATRPKEKITEDILDRLIEIEKHQWDTVDLETKRTKQRSDKPRSSSSSAKSWDRTCCSTCLQSACVGDCPQKGSRNNTCTLCREKLCIGACQESKYDSFMRQLPMEEQIESILNNPLPRICLTCQQKHNAKYINANNAILRRPKSGNSTYTHGQKSAKPTDLRPCSGTQLTNDILREIECLGLTATRPVSKSAPRSRSRNTLIVGKTYFSNRRDSLTGSDRSNSRKSTLKT